MQAVQLVAWQAEPELREIPVPEPGPGEVLVAVAAAGLCHTDLHIMSWPAGTVAWHLPFTLGHENAGTVAAFGPGTTGAVVGERVVVYGPWGCGSCRQCVRGAENLCPHRRGRGAGCGLDGGLAEHMLVPLLMNKTATWKPRRTVDVMPSALAALGLPVPEGLDGKRFI